MLRLRVLPTWLRPGAVETTGAAVSAPPCDLDILRRTIARSPIRLAAWTLEARLLDWENTRHAADIDAVILDWLASQGRLMHARHFDA
jgi:hypothetical protein